MKKLCILSLTVLIFAACNRHEIRETKLPNGQMVEQYQVKEIKDGSFVKDGYYKTWHANGQIEIQGEYANNKKIKQWKSWYANGQVMFNYSYKEDSLDGAYKKWFANGKIELSGNKDFGKSVGKWQSWHDNGQLAADENYSNGKAEGKFTYWFKNGQKQEEGEYKDGKKEGTWTIYDQDGKINSSRIFKAGKDISLVGKWLDKNRDSWEFFEDGSYILDIVKKNDRKKGSWGLNSDKLTIDRYDYDIKVLLKDTVYASHWERDFWYGSRETRRLQAHRVN